MSTSLDTTESDPAALGWMQGSPSPRERQVRFADGSMMRFPQIRWSFCHMRELLPTAPVWRGEGPASVLPLAIREDLDTVGFTPLGAAGPMTWAESLAANYTDGILVLHRGRIVQERYFGALQPHGLHAAWSVTKSLIGTIATMLAVRGELAPEAAVTRYVPELSESAWGTASVRHVMDMTCALRYSEDYTDPNAPVWDHGRAGGIAPRPPGYVGPETFHEFLTTVQAAGEHGHAFAYCTINTDVLGWIIQRVTGLSVAGALEHFLWRPMGAQEDACISVDASGTGFAGGGFSSTLRDLARMGELMRREGDFNGRQILPPEVVADVRGGADPAVFAKAGYALLPGWSYRAMWWVTHNPHGAFCARGIHGQSIYVDPGAEMVIARFASHPGAANANLDPTTLPAFHALGTHLLRHPVP